MPAATIIYTTPLPQNKYVKLKSSLTGKTMIESEENSAGRRATPNMLPRRNSRSVTGVKEENRTTQKFVALL